MPSSSAPGTFSRRTFAPVAIRALPKPISSRLESLAVRAAGSSFIAEHRVRTSISCSAYHSAGWNSASSRVWDPRRYSFEHGGRS